MALYYDSRGPLSFFPKGSGGRTLPTHTHTELGQSIIQDMHQWMSRGARQDAVNMSQGHNFAKERDL